MPQAEPTILPDVLVPGLAVVFCGTAASARSAAEQAYYAHPGNRFWFALHAAGFTPRQLAPAEFHDLPRYAIGLTDLAKHHSGNDDALPADAFDVDGLRDRIVRCAPRWLAFTSKRGAQSVLGHAVDYGLQTEGIGSTRLWVLPSPSGNARGHWSLAPWQALAARAHATPAVRNDAGRR